jgi:hypothetical protein
MVSVAYNAVHLVQSTPYSRRFGKRSKGKVVPVHAMMTYVGSRDTSALILNVSKKRVFYKEEITATQRKYIFVLNRLNKMVFCIEYIKVN